MISIRTLLCFSLILTTVPPLAAGGGNPAQTFEDWVPISTPDGNFYARRSDFDQKYAAAENTEQTSEVPLYTFDMVVTGQTIDLLAVTAAPAAFKLKIYPKGVAGIPLAVASTTDEEPTDISAAACRTGALYQCGRGLSIKWERSQPINVSLVTRENANGSPLLGNEEASLRRLQPRKAWLMDALRRTNAPLYEDLVSYWQSTGVIRGDVEHDFSEDGYALEWIQEPTNELSAMDLAYLKYMAPQETRDRVARMLGDSKITSAQKEALFAYVRSQTVAAHKGESADAQVQLEFLANNFSGIGSLNDEGASVNASLFDSTRKNQSGVETGEGDVLPVIVLGEGEEVDPTGNPAADFRPRVKRRPGTEVPLTADRRVDTPQEAGMLSGLKNFTKSPVVRTGASMIGGAVIGFLLGGPFGMAFGAMAGGLFGALFSQPKTSNT